MKKLGDRFDVGAGWFHVVEVNDYEYEQIKTLLTERSMPTEHAELKAWCVRFCLSVSRLNLDSAVANAINVTATMYTNDGAHYSEAFERDGVKPPLEFDEWAKSILESHNDKGEPLYPIATPYLGFRHVGKKGKPLIITALREYVEQAKHPT